MKFKVFEYDKCETCRKALRFLNENQIAFEKIPIVERPPSRSELEHILADVQKSGGSIKSLLNRSGQVYREMKLGAKLPSMTDAQVLDLLAQHGKLIKRPVVMGGDICLVGFRESEWRKAFQLPPLEQDLLDSEAEVQIVVKRKRTVKADLEVL